MKTKIIAISVMAFLLSIMASCSLLAGLIPTQVGDLSVEIVDESGSWSEENLILTKTDPVGRSEVVEVEWGSTLLVGLMPGDWTLTAEVTDGDGSTLGAGEGEAVIRKGKTESTIILVNGILDELPVPDDGPVDDPVVSDDAPWAGAGLTNPDALTVHNGTFYANVEGMVVENLLVYGQVQILADNVTVRNCRIYGDVYRGVRIFDNVRNAVVENCEIGNDGSYNLAGISMQTGSSYTIRKNWIHDVRDGISFAGSGSIEKNIITDVFEISEVEGDYHPDAIQTMGDFENVSITENYIEVSSDVTSAIIVSSVAGPVSGLTIRDNRIIGGGVTVYVRYNGQAPITDVDIVDNRFSWDYEVRLLSEDIGNELEFDGNVWYDEDLAVGATAADANGVIRTNGTEILINEY